MRVATVSMEQVSEPAREEARGLFSPRWPESGGRCDHPPLRDDNGGYVQCKNIYCLHSRAWIGVWNVLSLLYVNEKLRILQFCNVMSVRFKLYMERRVVIALCRRLALRAQSAGKG